MCSRPRAYIEEDWSETSRNQGRRIVLKVNGKTVESKFNELRAKQNALSSGIVDSVMQRSAETLGAREGV